MLLKDTWLKNKNNRIRSTVPNLVSLCLIEWSVFYPEIKLKCSNYFFSFIMLYLSILEVLIEAAASFCSFDATLEQN
jgi:hypothetical protein